MKSFKKGQKVWSVRGGYDTVAKVQEQYTYAIELESGVQFTIEGKFFTGDHLPTLFHDEPKDWPNPDPPCPFKVDQPLLVRDGDPLEWRLAYFAEMRNGTVSCWLNGLKSDLTAKTQCWAEYKTLQEELGE